MGITLKFISAMTSRNTSNFEKVYDRIRYTLDCHSKIDSTELLLSISLWLMKPSWYLFIALNIGSTVKSKIYAFPTTRVHIFAQVDYFQVNFVVINENQYV